MAGIVTYNPAAKNISLNTIQSWFEQDRKTNVSVQTLFKEQGWFRSCVEMRARSIQNMPWSITSTGSEDPIWSSEDAEVPENLQFVRNLPEMLYKFEASLVCTGRAYALKENAGSGVSGLMYFNPLKCETLKSANRGVYAIRRTVNHGQETYPVEDVLHFFASDPFAENGHLLGSGYAAKMHAQVLRAMDGFLNNFVEKGAIKATILGVKGGENIPPQERESLLSKWKAAVTGWFNGGSTHLFNADIEPHVIGEGFEGVGDKDITANQREAICNALGIPMSLVARTAANTKKEEDQLTYIVKTVIPEAKFIMREMNRQLFEPVGLQFFFEPKKLEEVQAAELKKAAAIQQLTGGKQVLRVNEAREWLGLDPDEFLDEEAQFDRSMQIAQSRSSQIEGTDDKPGEDEKKARHIDIPHLLLNDEGGYDYVHTTVKGDKLDDGVKKIAVDSDLRHWRRKVEKKGRDCKFSPDHLTDYESAIIRQRLATDEPLDDVFKPPFVGF